VEKKEGISGLLFDEPLIFERGSAGRKGVNLPEDDLCEEEVVETIPPSMVRGMVDGFPEVSQVELVRHFTRLSQWNYGVDSGFYPLGSCTMKYNPKLNEEAARLEGFAFAHPLQPEEVSQGALQILYELEHWLAEITGMDRATLQPAAGAHGELTGMMMIKAFFRRRGEARRKVLIPDTAHGTNPASVTMCGYTPVPLRSTPEGIVDIDTVVSNMDEDVAGIMLTNPNTLGIFESSIRDIADVVHRKGGLVYCDGANLNALMGIVRYGDTGVDLVHINLHKTFSTPHGGGGPGAGALAVKKHLVPFLPVPVVERKGNRFVLGYNRKWTIGKVRSFYGNFLICLRAYAYIASMGAEGLKRASIAAVVNANYIKNRLKSHYYLPYKTPCLHECVFTDRHQQERGITTLDIAKRLIDYGFHPPTIYFPLVVQGALMIEPTETESRETLDRFIEAMLEIADEALKEPQKLKSAPHRSKITRVDEVTAARKPILRWQGRKGKSS